MSPPYTPLPSPDHKLLFNLCCTDHLSFCPLLYIPQLLAFIRSTTPQNPSSSNPKAFITTTMRAVISLYEHPDLSADYYDYENEKSTSSRATVVVGTICVAALAAVAYLTVMGDSRTWGFFEKNIEVLQRFVLHSLQFCISLWFLNAYPTPSLDDDVLFSCVFAR